jgi:hypothetical protein
MLTVLEARDAKINKQCQNEQRVSQNQFREAVSFLQNKTYTFNYFKYYKSFYINNHVCRKIINNH